MKEIEIVKLKSNEPILLKKKNQDNESKNTIFSTVFNIVFKFGIL